MAERMMQDDAQDVVRSVIAAAGNGDMAAARLVLDRVLPVRRGRSVRLNLPAIASATDVTAALAMIVTAVGSGEITIEEAAGLATVIEAARRSVELVEIDARLCALEQRAQAHANS
jgi:hypothetical protein